MHNLNTTSYICNFRKSFEIFKTQFVWVQVINRERIKYLETENVCSLTLVDRRILTVVLTDVAHSPEMMMNFSFQSCVRKAGSIIIADSINQSPTDCKTQTIYKISGETTIDNMKKKEGFGEAVMIVGTTCVSKIKSYKLWHKQLCLVGSHSLSLDHRRATRVPKPSTYYDNECNCYEFAVSIQKPRSPVSKVRVLARLKHVFSDVVEPTRNASIRGSAYFVTMHGKYSDYYLTQFTIYRSTVGIYVIKVIRGLPNDYTD